MSKISVFADDGSDWIWTELDLRIKHKSVEEPWTNRFPTMFRKTTLLRAGNTKNENLNIEQFTETYQSWG
jgi:hypothetical protein